MGRKYIKIKIGKKATPVVAKKRPCIVENWSYNYETCHGVDDEPHSFDSYAEARDYVRAEMKTAENAWMGGHVDSDIGCRCYSVEIYDPTWGYDQLFYGDYWVIKDAETGEIISPLSNMQ